MIANSQQSDCAMIASVLRFNLSLPLALLLVNAAHAASPTCIPFIDAFAKMQKVPVHQYMTEDRGFPKGEIRRSEMIALNGHVYIRVNGTWQLSPMTPEDRQKMTADSVNEKNVTCSTTAGEVNGQAATVYTAHRQDEDTKIETHLWVSKTNGLPLKQETDVGGRIYSTIRYEYTNVQVPPGVK